MTLNRLLLSLLVTALMLPAVRAAETLAAGAENAGTSPGALVGLVTNSAKLPVGRATVTAVRAAAAAFVRRCPVATASIRLPIFPPGAWSVTAQLDGYPDVTVPSLQVAASKATRYDIVMNAPAAAAAPAPAPAPASVAQTVTVPAGLQAPEASTGVDNFTPFAYGDFTWLNGSPRNHQPAFDTKFFTPDIRFDAHYMDDFNHPQDHTIVGSTESFRSGEFQLEQVSVGGDFHWENVRARILSMVGLFATTTPRNDASSGVGQWDLHDAYRYVSEANGGYHFNVNHGLNVDAGIFVSYIGLFSYYNFDNWTYQPSYVSSNTPWFFNGVRIQWFPTNKLKIEPWIINGWQSYARFNGHLGFGGQILWQPNEWFKLVFNNYGVGEDNLANTPGNPARQRHYAITPTTASRSGTTTIPTTALASPRWRSPSRRMPDASTAVELHCTSGAEQERLSRLDALQPFLVPPRSVSRSRLAAAR